MTTDRTDEGAFGPQLATPQTLFDGRDAVEDLTGRETFDDLDHLGRAVARHRLHQKMHVVFVSPNLQKRYLEPLADFQADFFELLINWRREHGSSVLCWTDDVIHQYRDVMTFVDVLAHPHILAQQAAGNYTPRD